MQAGLPPVDPDLALLQEAAELIMREIWRGLSGPLATLLLSLQPKLKPPSQDAAAAAAALEYVPGSSGFAAFVDVPPGGIRAGAPANLLSQWSSEEEGSGEEVEESPAAVQHASQSVLSTAALKPGKPGDSLYHPDVPGECKRRELYRPCFCMISVFCCLVGVLKNNAAAPCNVQLQIYVVRLLVVPPVST